MCSGVAPRQLAEGEQLTKTNMNFVYVIFNSKNNKFYIGQTKNLKNRLDLHNQKNFLIVIRQDLMVKWELIYHEIIPDT